MLPWLLCPLLALPPTPIDSFDDLAAWSLNRDGGSDLTWRVDHDLVASPPGALRLVFGAGGTNAWGNLTRAVKIPPDATGVRLKLRPL